MAANEHSHGDTLGWLAHMPLLTMLPWVLMLVGFGHSVLAMSGEESLAQVNREIEHPKLKNLEKAGAVIFLYSLLFTSLVSFFAVMIIPDHKRPEYFANLISGLAMYMAGPYNLKLIFQGFVVLVGVLILSGAVNTAIVGANGVLNRISEDGVLTPWFRKPHGKYGTSHRLINLIAFLQCFTIIAQPRQRLSAGGAVRLRRDLELRLQVAGGAGAALHRAGRSRLPRAGQHPHRLAGASHRAGADHPAAVCHRAGQPDDQAAGDDGRRQLLGLPVRRLHGFGKDHAPAARRASRDARGVPRRRAAADRSRGDEGASRQRAGRHPRPAQPVLPQ